MRWGEGALWNGSSINGGAQLDRPPVPCDRTFKRPQGILWNILDDDKRDAIPVLGAFKASGQTW